MIDTAPTPIRSAAESFRAWRCSGTLKDGRECRRVLMELDYSRTTLARKICDKCGAVNVLDLDSIRLVSPQVMTHP